ncbi:MULTISPECIES: hypothetical protein [Haloarcula]|uniref:Uncharacterized protein n=4 Tax=Haloarcula TaxID=2237 RepID=Q5UXV6_HALMA|nr:MULTISPECIES: hypothetical protein [Haloarcula]AAV47897.1 unknown [Haloarcula marismortui ATCC 43049]EMA12095.1 hypothetical protein C436_14784 [Haloarcula sinaiiensis ATCC 33800]NHN63907.1 hypothetical protein [Haloarcula sp. JP-Z28]
MAMELADRMAPADMLVFGTAFGLAGLAVFNYATGVYGGAIVSSVGTVVTTLFGVFTD